MENCPLCSSNSCDIFFEDKNRKYFLCHNCSLVFVPERFHLSGEAERERYDKHNNSIDDEGYVSFLSGAVEAVKSFAFAGSCGLDFGCGENPVLAELLKREGFSVDVYDPFYFEEDFFKLKKYDFITATEVVEHFSNPAKEFALLSSLLKDGGVFVVMTNLYDGVDFNSWWYKGDSTHISFFSKRSFEFFAETYGFKILKLGNLSIFKKFV